MYKLKIQMTNKPNKTFIAANLENPLASKKLLTRRTKHVDRSTSESILDKAMKFMDN